MGAFDFSSPDGVLNFIGLLIKIGGLIEPAIESIWNDWNNKKITTEEADAQAGGKFTAMAAALADPHGDAAKLNAAEDAKLAAKFDTSDAPAPASKKTEEPAP